MTMLLGRSPAYSDSDESIISTNSVQVKIFNLRTLWDIFSSHSRTYLWSYYVSKKSFRETLNIRLGSKFRPTNDLIFAR